jgi:RHS repeat-associated protein
MSLGEPVSTWIGTDDTPTSGYWSPSNPAGMTLVSCNVYDNGGVGDGNLTQTTLYPGGSQAPRITQNYYNWQDEQVASKSGVILNDDGTEDLSAGTIRGDGTIASSEYGVLNLFQGMRFDPVTGLYETPNRGLNPATGTWLQSDPAEYVDGTDTYQVEGSAPMGLVDPEGLAFDPLAALTNTIAGVGNVVGNGISGGVGLVGGGIQGLGGALGNNPIGNTLKGAGGGVSVAGQIAGGAVDAAGRSPGEAVNLANDAGNSVFNQNHGVVAPPGKATVCPSKAIVVHIWPPLPLKGHIGHASATLPDGTYVSWWPGTYSTLLNAPVYPPPGRNLGQDTRDEEGVLPTDYVVPNVNTQAILNWWSKYQSSHGRWIGGGPNCATVVVDALGAGGIKPPARAIWFPFDLRPLLNTLALPPSSVTFAPIPKSTTQPVLRR